MFKRFIQYYKPHKTLFFLDMGAALLTAVCDLFYPIITRTILNDYLPTQILRPLGRCLYASRYA